MSLLNFRFVSLRFTFYAVLWISIIISWSNFLRPHSEEIVEYWEGVKRSEKKSYQVHLEKHIGMVDLEVSY